MDLSKELIKVIMSKISDEAFQNEKPKYEEVLIKIFGEHVKPKDAMGFSNETIEYIYSYGYRLYNNGNYKKAADVFAMLLVLDPTDSRFPLALGACNHRLKNWAEAVQNYYLAGVLEATSPLPFYYIFDCYIQNNFLQEAALCLEEVIKRAGNQEAYAKIKQKSKLLLEGLKKG